MIRLVWNYVGVWLSDRHASWWYKPIRCYHCRKWFAQGDFWNPWGPGDGPGLCCSEECCDKVEIC